MRYAVWIGILLMTGCAAGVWYGNPTAPKSAILNIGMTKQQVQQSLGPPQHVSHQSVNGAMVETWRYLDQMVTFQNGLVQTWTSHTTTSTPTSCPTCSGSP